jgi:hypothetical protein
MIRLSPQTWHIIIVALIIVAGVVIGLVAS